MVSLSGWFVQGVGEDGDGDYSTSGDARGMQGSSVGGIYGRRH